MNVSLGPELEALVAAKVDTGRYQSASEVVREALRLLEERDELRALRREELRSRIQRNLATTPSGGTDAVDIIPGIDT